MIVAIVGASSRDTKAVAKSIAGDTLKVIDIVEALKEELNNNEGLSEVIIDKFISDDNLKKICLKGLEEEYKTIVVVGNLGLNENVLKWLQSLESSLTVVVNREGLNHFSSEELKLLRENFFSDSELVYEVENRFYDLYNHLDNNEKSVLLNPDNDESLDNFANILEKVELLDSNFSGRELQGILMDLLGGRNMNNIEESIRKAMIDLGIKPDDATDVAKDLTKHPKSDLKEHKKSIEDKPEDEVKKSKPKEDKEDKEDTEPNSLFCKISDGRMALLIPEGIHLDSMEISGVKFKVVTTKIPDISNNNLQELEEVVEDKKPQTKSKTFTHKKVLQKSSDLTTETKSIVKSEPFSENLDDLKDEKSRLDDAIKQARAAGNQELVESLRKERRAVRKKINAAKG